MRNYGYSEFFHEVTGNEGERCHYSTRLDPYGRGCQHDCSYCYAKSLLHFRKMWDNKSPMVFDPAKVAQIVARLPRDKVIRIGGMTDPFQPLERREQVTWLMLRALNKCRVPYLIVTKSDMVAEDKYVRVLDPDLAHIQVTITSTDDALAGTYEHAPAPSRRIAAVEKLAALGYDVQVRLSPYIPDYVDMDVINAIRCDKILVEFLRVNTWIERWMKTAPAVPLDDWTHYHGGYRHLPLERKRELLNAVTGFSQVSVCEDVPEDWTYWRDHVNANPNDCCNLRTCASTTK